MSGELNLWTSRAVERQDNRQLARIESSRNVSVARVARERDISLAKVDAVADVGRAALVRTLDLGMTRRQVEMMVPETSGILEAIMIRTGMAMADQIERPGRA